MLENNHTIGIYSLRIAFTAAISVAFFTAAAQRAGEFSNLHTRIVRADVAVQALDSLTIVTPLVNVTDSAAALPLDLRFFSLHNNRLYIDTAGLALVCNRCRSVRVTYRVLPVSETMLFGVQPFISDMTAMAVSQRFDTAEIMRENYFRRAKIVEKAQAAGLKELLDACYPEFQRYEIRAGAAASASPMRANGLN